ncbi:uncharacterized protein [Cherax quadricarinatus]|uniref:uncharacterized protein n=1 Tax=Cherax quadricarinatus TaxID=27406 RepID=UPI0023788E29|nr:uncharacterized protein LOC128692859 [Cherax quadricarinatus]
MTHHSISFLVSVVAVLLSVVMDTSKGQCPVPHRCTGFGLELLATDTGEAAFCIKAGADPVCPGVYVNGTTIFTTSTASTMTTSSANPGTNTTTTTVTTTNSSTSTTSDTISDTTSDTTSYTTSDTTSDTTIISITTTAQVLRCDVPSCVDKHIGVYAYPECKCEKYYTCSKSASDSSRLVLHQYTCSGGKVFSNVTNVCVTNRLACPYPLR